MKLKPRNCLTAFFASAFQAFGIYHIHAVSEITEGGVFGATLLLDHWFGISPALSSLILNAALFALGLKTLGRTFIGYSAFAAVGYSIAYRICEQFPPFWPGIAAHPILAAILGALFVGIGAGLCVRSGGATSGDDALAISSSRIFKIKIEYIYMISDAFVLLLSLSYIPLGRIGYSLLTVLLSGKLIGVVQRMGRKPGGNL